MKKLALTAMFALSVVLSAFPDGTAASPYTPKNPGKIRFALCQTPCASTGMTNQVTQVLKWVSLHLQGDEDVIVLPELAFASFQDLKSAWKEAAAVWCAAAAFARERGAYLFVNHPEREEDGGLFNETRVFAPDGNVIATYRKRELANMDIAASFSEGRTVPLVALPFAKVGVLICKDAFIPSRKADYAQADILVAQFAHPGVLKKQTPEQKWLGDPEESLRQLRSSRYIWRALEKPYLAVNKAGLDGDFILVGGTFATDVSGRMICPRTNGPQVLIADFVLTNPIRKFAKIVPSFSVPARGGRAAHHPSEGRP